MTLNQIECFIMLAQRLNFTQAAADLFMAQPALSRQISALESEVGVQLFTRTHRSVSLTPAGAAFQKECPHILDSYQYSVDAALQAKKGLRGSVSMGVLRDSMEPALADLYQALAVAYPKIRIRFHFYSHSELMMAFEHREVDVILNNSNTEPEKMGYPYLTLRRNQQCVITSLHHPLAQQDGLRMEDLREEPFVVMSRTVSFPGHDYVWMNAAEAGFSLHVVAEARYIPTLLNLVSCGVGISTLGDDFVYMAQGKIRFIPLLGVPPCQTCLMWHEDQDNPAVPQFLDVARSLLYMT